MIFSRIDCLPAASVRLFTGGDGESNSLRSSSIARTQHVGIITLCSPAGIHMDHRRRPPQRGADGHRRHERAAAYRSTGRPCHRRNDLHGLG
jgi:hypothetical protein